MLLSVVLCSCSRKEQPKEARYFDEPEYAMADSYSFEAAENYEMMFEESAVTSNIMAKSVSAGAVNASEPSPRMIKRRVHHDSGS